MHADERVYPSLSISSPLFAMRQLVMLGLFLDGNRLIPNNDKEPLWLRRGCAILCLTSVILFTAGFLWRVLHHNNLCNAINAMSNHFLVVCLLRRSPRYRTAQIGDR